MQMQFERSREKQREEVLEDGPEALALQNEPRVKMAALYKAILNPNYFDNYRFWRHIYVKGIDEEFLKFANRMSFLNGEEDGEYFLGSSGDTYYFARWPNLTEVIFALKHQLTKEETINLLFNCHYYPFQTPAFREQMKQVVDMVYGPSYVHCEKFNEEHLEDGFLGLNRTFHTSILVVNRTFHTSSASIWLKVLSGFMAALGAAALVLALTTLSTPAAPVAPVAAVAAVVGVALLAGSYGLFKYADRMPPAVEEHEPTFQPR